MFDMDYSLIKALHFIFVVSWFAGLFYIFRLYVYHIENWQSLEIHALLSTMERKLLNFITTPAMILSLGFGLYMLTINPALLQMPWMHIKLTFVVVLLGYHGYSYFVYSMLKRRQKILTSKACRMINEVPTVVLVVVGILVFLKRP